jgi:hypothetical protein
VEARQRDELTFFGFFEPRIDGRERRWLVESDATHPAVASRSNDRRHERALAHSVVADEGDRPESAGLSLEEDALRSPDRRLARREHVGRFDRLRREQPPVDERNRRSRLRALKDLGVGDLLGLRRDETELSAKDLESLGPDEPDERARRDDPRAGEERRQRLGTAHEPPARGAPTKDIEPVARQLTVDEMAAQLDDAAEDGVADLSPEHLGPCARFSDVASDDLAAPIERTDDDLAKDPACHLGHRLVHDVELRVGELGVERDETLDLGE